MTWLMALAFNSSSALILKEQIARHRD